MCGIAGKLYFNKDRKVTERELHRMTNLIKHRGPDDHGYHCDDNVGLGFRRLSIIDLKLGHQPMSNGDASVWITFNGEIYNYKELRDSLKNKGYEFRTSCDTEVILNLYLEYEEDCLQHLRGMFAFIIWDKNKQVIFGARDRFGIKPLHYYIDEKQFIWGSEIKSILANDLNKNTVDIGSLDYYLAYGYTPIEQTIYSQIKKVKPGHYFRIDLGKKNNFEMCKYWDVKFTPDYTKSKEYWKEEIRKALLESVKIRMRSDVPLGAFLSGGIDSSIVVALMSMNSTSPIKTFSIGFKEEKYNELKYARLVSNRYKTDHKEFIVEPESIDLLPKLVNAYDEPFGDSSAIPTYYISKFTKEHVTVALTGDGGDELFSGYNSYSKMLSLKGSSDIFNKLYSNINRILPDYFYGKGITYYKSKKKSEIGAYFTLFKDYERRGILNEDIRNEISINQAEQIKKDIIYGSNIDFLSKMQLMDIKTYLSDDILCKVDRASMLNSLEARVPLLDHKFAELTFNIPSELKYNNGDKKAILKETFKDILPGEVLSHKKQGFAVPLNEWFKGDLKEYSYDTLLNSKHLYDYLDKFKLTQILDNHQKGLRNYSSKIWSLLFLNEWLNQQEFL